MEKFIPALVFKNESDCFEIEVFLFDREVKV